MVCRNILVNLAEKKKISRKVYKGGTSIAGDRGKQHK